MKSTVIVPVSMIAEYISVSSRYMQAYDYPVKAVSTVKIHTSIIQLNP
jgi:hypothetical protein